MSDIDNKYCVYLHKDVNDIVRYVGSGRVSRANTTNADSSRGKNYSDFVNKHSKLIVEIIAINLTKPESIELECKIYDKFVSDGNLLNSKRPSKEIALDKEYLSKYVYYCESSPSCLKWNITETKKIKGTNAGTLSEKDGYWHITIKSKQMKVHRIVAVLNGFDVKEKFVDHVNRDRSDNRISNLHICEPIVNCWNRSRISRNKSGVNGVSWNGRVQSWIVRWREDGKERRKIFPVRAYENAEDAKLAAIQCRELMKNIHMPHITDTAVDTSIVYERKFKGRITNKTGENNILFRESVNAYVVSYYIQGKKHTKNFSVLKIGDKDLAFQQAIEFRNNIGGNNEQSNL